jgi:hypothetical protein
MIYRLSLLAAVASAFSPVPGLAPAVQMRSAPAQMTATLDKELVKTYPRDFSKIPIGTAYGEGADAESNKAEEDTRLEGKLAILKETLKKVAESRDRPLFTTALIAGDCVIMDVICKLGLQDKIQIVFIDTFFLFEETVAFMKEVESCYGIKAKWYQCADCKDAEEFYDKYGARPRVHVALRPSRPRGTETLASTWQVRRGLLDGRPRGLRQEVQGRAAPARAQGGGHGRMDQRPPPRPWV